MVGDRMNLTQISSVLTYNIHIQWVSLLSHFMHEEKKNPQSRTAEQQTYYLSAAVSMY